jgi:hypothetical protein
VRAEGAVGMGSRGSRLTCSVLAACLAIAAVARTASAASCDGLEQELRALERAKGPRAKVAQFIDRLKERQNCDEALRRATMATRAANLLDARIAPPAPAETKPQTPVPEAKPAPTTKSVPATKPATGTAKSLRKSTPPEPKPVVVQVDRTVPAAESAAFEAALEISRDAVKSHIAALVKKCAGGLSKCSSQELHGLLEVVFSFLQQVRRLPPESVWTTRSVELLRELPDIDPAVLRGILALVEHPSLFSGSAPPAVASSPEVSQLPQELRDILGSAEGEERVRRLLAYLTKGDAKTRDEHAANYALALRLADEDTARSVFQNLARRGRVSVLVRCADDKDALCLGGVRPLVEAKLTKIEAPGQLVFETGSDGEVHDIAMTLSLVDPVATPALEAPCQPSGTRADRRCILARVHLDAAEQSFWSAPFAAPTPEKPSPDLETRVAELLRRIAEGIAAAYSYRDMWIGPVRVVGESPVDTAPTTSKVSPLPMSALRQGLLVGSPEHPEFPNLMASLRTLLEPYQADVLGGMSTDALADQVRLETGIAACNTRDAACQRLEFRLVYHRNASNERGVDLLAFEIEAPAGEQFVPTIAEEARSRIVAYYLDQRATWVESATERAAAVQGPTREHASPPVSALLFAGLPHPTGSSARTFYSWMDLGLTLSGVGFTLGSIEARHAYSHSQKQGTLDAANGLLTASAVAFAGVVITRVVSWVVASTDKGTAESSAPRAAAPHNGPYRVGAASTRAYRGDLHP